jgi:RNA polymerase sigma-70 factor (ECF subfamily)
MRASERRLARAAVRRLPQEQRQAVALAYWAGLSAQELAAVERIPLGTAKSRVRLGLEKLSRDPELLAA